MSDEHVLFHRVGDLLADSTLEDAAFAERYGQAFLLRHGGMGSLKIPDGPTKTMLSESRESASGSGRISHDFLVFPVRDTSRTISSSFISVGRTANNDIQIPDISVSKLHAFITERDGAYLILDAGTQTGTRVNGDDVPVREQGKAVQLESGDEVEFGEVTASFMTVADFLEFLRRVA